MHPKGASKNKDDQAIFSKDGPNLIRPALTNRPSVIPKIYKLKNNKNKGKPNSKIRFTIIIIIFKFIYFWNYTWFVC